MLEKYLQVLQEFYVTATKKLGADPLAVKDILHSFRRFETVVVTPTYCAILPLAF